MHDAVAGRDHVDVLEGGLGPLNEVEAVLVASLLDGSVLFERIGIETGKFHRKRVVDDQLSRHHRIDLRWVAALLRDRIAQTGEVDERGLAKNVMADDACRIPGKVEVALALDDLLQRIGQRFGLTATHQLFGQNAGRIGQLVIGTRLNSFDRLTGVKVVKPSTWQSFAVFCIHAGRTQFSNVLWGKVRGARDGLPRSDQRWAIGTTLRCSGPMYSALGRMIRLLLRCSNTWDAQPVTREQTKIGVNSLVGMPMK